MVYGPYLNSLQLPGFFSIPIRVTCVIGLRREEVGQGVDAGLCVSRACDEAGQCTEFFMRSVLAGSDLPVNLTL